MYIQDDDMTIGLLTDLVKIISILKKRIADRYNLTFLIHTSIDKKPIIVYDDIRLI